MDYAAISKTVHTHPVPGDWSVIIADIKGSTALMSKGRQAEVNLIGAACIAAIRNSHKTKDVPYVFGGDGATFLCSPSNLPSVLRILRKVRSNSWRNLAIELRIGSILIRDLYARGAKLSLGFLKGKEDEALPYFRGSAISLADRLIKEQWAEDVPTGLTDIGDLPNLKGLGCLHQPFNSLRGKILCVIVDFREGADEDEILDNIFNTLTINGPIDRLRPVQKENLRRSWIGPAAKSESKILYPGLSAWKEKYNYLHTSLKHIFSKIIFHLDLIGTATGLSSYYTERLLDQSDWIKMDGSLRLVIDVNDEEEAALIEALELHFREGGIFYGTFASESALMTCHLKTLEGQEHAHFIDGANGGLTLAAMDLKKKKQAASAA